MARISKEDLMKKAEELSNSRPLDVHKISDYPQVKAVLQQLYDEMDAAGLVNARNKEKLRKHLRVFALDLYHAHCMDETMYIAYSRNKGRYAPGTRLHKLFLSYRMAVKVADFLIKHKYVEHAKHRHAREGSGKGSYQSRMRASQKLIDLIEAKGVVPEMVVPEIPKPDETRLVILRKPKEKDKPPQEIEYEDTPETFQMKENLKLINNNNRQHGILLYLKDKTLKALSKRMNRDPDRGPLDYSKKYLHRVFNNGSWEQGGRFFGVWWQGVPRVFREFIRINDKDVVECDFSGMHVNMLYAWEKEPMPEEDVYHIEGYSNDHTFRQFVKQLLLMIVNAENREKARSAIQHKVNKKKLKLPKEVESTAGKHLFPLIDAFEQKHEPIRHYFCTGKGIDLQYHDSQIAEKVMLHFAKKRMAILPLHDSFIIHHGLERELKNAMNKAFKELFGVNTKIDIKYNSIRNRQRRGKGPQIVDTSNMVEIFKLDKPYSVYFRNLNKFYDQRPAL